MAPLHLLHQDDCNQVKHDFFGHATQFALPSHDVDRTVNDTFAFIRSTVKMRCNMIFGHVMPLSLAMEDNQNQVQNDFSGYVTPLVSLLVSCDVSGIINSITAFVRLR